MQMLKKVLNIIVDVLIIIMLIVSVIVAGLALTSKNDGVSNILGYVPLSVQSPSMEPEFYQGDLIISKVVDDDTEIKVDDIITFATTIEGIKVLNTHRVIEVQESDGFMFYITKGDNNPIADAEPVIENDVVAVYDTGICLGGFGTIYDFLTSQMGFFLVILLPLIIFFLYEVFRVVKNLIEYNKEKAYNEAVANASNNSGLSDEEMKLAVEKYLAQQKAEQEAQSASSDKTDTANTNNTEE